MRRKAQFTIAALLLGLAGTAAAAESPSCTGVSDIKARTTCQMQKRRHYGVQLETSLFKLAPTDPTRHPTTFSSRRPAIRASAAIRD